MTSSTSRRTTCVRASRSGARASRRTCARCSTSPASTASTCRCSSATLESNEITISDVVDRIVAHGGRNIAVLGLSFKTETDDLRESPNVDLVRDLARQGLQHPNLRPDRQAGRLVGTNQSYVESKLAHLQRLLTESVGDALRRRRRGHRLFEGPSVVAALVATPPPLVVDISGRLGPQVESVPGYWGIGW